MEEWKINGQINRWINKMEATRVDGEDAHHENHVPAAVYHMEHLHDDDDDDDDDDSNKIWIYSIVHSLSNHKPFIHASTKLQSTHSSVHVPLIHPPYTQANTSFFRSLSGKL